VSVFTLVAALLEAVFLALVTQSILTVAAGDDSFTLVTDRSFTVTSAVICAAILLAARFVLLLGAVRVHSGLFETLLVGLRSRLGSDYLAASWPAQSRFQRGLLQQLVMQMPASIVSLAYQLIAALTGGIALIALLVVAFLIEPLTALIVFAIVVLLASGLLPIRRAVRRRAAEALNDQMILAAKVSELADLSLEVNAMNVSNEALEGLDALVRSEARTQRRMGFHRDLVNPVYTTLAFASIAVAIVILRELGTGDLQATGSVLLIMLRSLGYGQQLQHGASALAQVAPALRVLDEQRSDLSANPRIRGSRRIDGFDTLRLENVSFGYDDSPHALNQVSLDVERGDLVGIVGPSGSGKTTLVHLVLGLRAPSVGAITVDAHPITEIAADSWARLVAYVPQETRLLDGSIADNVQFLRSDISDSDVDRALAAAGLHLDVERFPRGSATPVGAAGRELSGGQKQRLAIARALVSQPSLLVLDEPTSSLDSESDEAIVETLRRLRGSVAVLVVSHRDSTLAACDRVILVEAGRVSTVR
jgi:ABC-type multidrug transport system fused ATPase/permease subunit